MLQKVVLICLLQQLVFSTSKLKDLNSQLKVYYERIRNINYTQYTFQQLTLTYDSYPEVFSQRLYKQVNQNQSVQQEIMSSFQEVQTIQVEGCSSFLREITTGDTQIVPLPKPEGHSYTDFIGVPKHLRAYMARNDFTIIQADLEIDQDQLYLSPALSMMKFTEVLKLEKDISHDSNPQLLYDEKTDKIFLFTSVGAVSFSYEKQFSDTKFDLETEFIQRENIYEVHFDSVKGYVYVVAGENGVDVYSIDQGHIKFLTTIINQKHSTFKIVDVATRKDTLFVLDEQWGFYTINVQYIENYFQTEFLIEIGHGRSFDFHQNTFIFIATSIHRQDYAFEVFIDFNSDTFYINRFYIDEMQLYDVVVYDFYAILIGYDTHRIIYHSLYNGFDKSQEKIHEFSQSELLKVIEFEWNNNKTHHQIIGLGISQLLTFQVKYNHPKIKCRSTQPLYEVLKYINYQLHKNYLLQMNSTNCNTKQGNQDFSQFSQCIIQHKFNYITKQPFLLGIYKSYVFIAIFIVILVIITLIWALYACWKRWMRILEFMDKQVLDLKKQEKYGEQHNIQGEECDSNPNQDMVDVEKQQIEKNIELGQMQNIQS